MDSAVLSLFGDNVGATLATTVAARAKGASLFGVTDWDDPQAREVYAALTARAAAKGVDLDALCCRSRGDVVGTIRRSQVLDDETRAFAAAHPGGQVLSIGIGLCNRAARLADLPLTWVGSDREAVIALRRELIPDDVTRLVVGEGASPAVLEALDPDLPTLILVEGVLMYLTTSEVTEMLRALRERVTTATFVADLFDTDTARHHDEHPPEITNTTGATYSFRVAGAKGLAALTAGWQAAGELDVMARISKKFGIMSQLYRLSHRGRRIYLIARLVSVPFPEAR